MDPTKLFMFDLTQVEVGGFFFFFKKEAEPPLGIASGCNSGSMVGTALQKVRRIGAITIR